MKLLIICLLASVSTFAGFEKLTVQNLDLEYNAPYGKGTVEKVGIGLGLNPEAFPIEFIRTESTIDLISPYVDFSWYNPLKFVYDIEHATTKKLSSVLGAKDRHYVKSELLIVRPKEASGDYRAEGVEGECPAEFKGSFDQRLLEDCRKSLNLTIKKIDVPVDFFLLKVLEDLPQLPGQSAPDMPGDNIIAKIENGDLYLQIYVKFWFYAGLRTWGHVQYENDYQTIALRVDQIKFGYLTVTNLVMKKLKEVIKSPDVRIDPPWIRIDVRKLREHQQD